MFFVVALKLEPGPQELKMQAEELTGVQWMTLEEYFAVPFTATRPLFRQIHAACRAYADGTYRCGVETRMCHDWAA